MYKYINRKISEHVKAISYYESQSIYSTAPTSVHVYEAVFSLLWLSGSFLWHDAVYFYVTAPFSAQPYLLLSLPSEQAEEEEQQSNQTPAADPLPQSSASVDRPVSDNIVVVKDVWENPVSLKSVWFHWFVCLFYS